MQDRYYEEPVTRSPENIQTGKIRMSKVMIYGAIVFLIVAVVAFPTLENYFGYLSSPKVGVGDKILFCVLSALPVVVGAILLFFGLRLKAKATEEFEYRLQDCKFRIIRVTNHSRRKLLCEFPLDSIETIGKIDSENCRQAENRIGNNRKAVIFARVNISQTEDQYYAVINNYNYKLMYFEPSKTLITEIQFALNRKVLDL